MKTAAVILAAGKGSRFHSNQYKLLASERGEPVIVKTLKTVLSSGFDEVVVVIGCHAEEMNRILQDYPVKIIVNHAWESGQSTSLTAGIRAVENSADRACLLLGDQPYLQSQTIMSMMAVSAGHPDEIIVPEFHGKRGNPIIVPAYRYPLLLELAQGDMGGRKLLEAVGYYPFKTEDPGVIRDVDTVEDLTMERTNFWKIENKDLVPQMLGTKTIADTSPFTPLGAYTTFRTYGKFGVLRFTKHMDRLEETSALAGFTVRLDRPMYMQSTIGGCR